MVPSDGPKNAKVALVSRSPGKHDIRAKKPFGGPSGKVLDWLLKSNGGSRDETLVTNVVLCAPKETKVPPSAIRACKPRLVDELRSVDTIIAAGSEAVREILGKSGIDRLRGYEHRSNGQRVVVTNNPALVLRDDTTFPNLRKDFHLVFNPRKPVKLPEVKVYGHKRPEEAIKWLRDSLSKQSIANYYGADIESRGGISHKASIVTCQVSLDGATGIVFGEAACNDEEFRRAFNELLAHPGTIWHNGKFDVKILRTQGLKNAYVYHDTMLLSYALDERTGGYHDQAYLLMDYLNWPDYEPESVKRFKKTGVVEDWEEFYNYAGLDAAGNVALFEVMKEEAIKDNVYDKPYLFPLLDISESLTRMELRGVRYNYHKAADIYEDDVEPELLRVKDELRKLVDKPILNPNSPDQMSALYYDEWQIKHPAQDRPERKRSTDAGARETILEGNYRTKTQQIRVWTGSQTEKQKIVEKEQKLIVVATEKYDRFKKLSKQATQYLIKMIEKAEADPDGRIYTEFSETGTESGRISSKKPNLQNVTRTKEGLPNIRGLFEPTPGRIIVQADYSQAELRTIAKLSGDRNLLDIYYDTNRSIHKEMAASFYGENYTYEEYVKAKNIDFGVSYRQGAFSFSRMYHMPEREAQEFIDAFFARFPKVYKWGDDTIAEVKEKGHLVSPFGYKRRFHLITDENKQHVFKEAINFRPQNTAAVLTLCACNTINDEVDTGKLRPLYPGLDLILTVHDSIVADVQESYAEEFAKVTKQVMESRAKELLGWDLPFLADFSIGPNWGDLEEIEV